MGLDMYAYTLNRDLAESYDYKSRAECDPRKWARRATGFIDLSEDEIEKLSEQDRQAYYASARKANERAEDAALFNGEFAYWRKFNHLHGWMERLYQERGGTDSFNCIAIWLDEESIDRLEREAADLKPTQGFFFGSYDPMDDDDRAAIAEFIAKCRAAFAAGDAVFYDSWW